MTLCMIAPHTPAPSRATKAKTDQGVLVLCLCESHRREWARRLAETDPLVSGDAVVGTVRTLVQRVLATQPGVAIHELAAPLLSSERLIRAIRSMAPSVPLVAVASAHGPEAELAARRSGATLYAVWPEDGQVIFHGVRPRQPCQPGAATESAGIGARLPKGVPSG